MTRRIGILLLACALWLGPFVTVPRAQDADRGLGELAFAAGDYRTALRAWRPLANSGDAQAQYRLGLHYARGLGIARDLATAAEWYTRAAQQGLAAAQFEIANLLMENLDRTPELTSARRWYRLAADQGHPEAAARLSRLFRNDEAVSTAGGNSRRTKNTADLDTVADQQDPYTLLHSTGRCKPVDGRDFKIDVVLDLPPAPVDHSRGIAELNGAGPHGPGQIVGLAAPDLEISTSGAYGFLDRGDHKCFWVEHVEARVVYRSMKIYIASEYKKGSCPYGQILRHEKEHVSIARINLNRYRPRLRTALASLSIPKPGQPLRIGPNDDPRAQMTALFDRLVAPVFEKMMADLEAAQARIDTPRSYARTRRRCRNW